MTLAEAKTELGKLTVNMEDAARLITSLDCKLSLTGETSSAIADFGSGSV